MTDQDQPNTPQLYLITPVGAAASTVGPLLADVMDRFPVACLRIPGAGTEDELGRLYGSASPSRVRRLLDHLERQGRIVVREDW